MKYIELSHKISKRTITYPTDPDFEINVEKTIDKNNSLLHSFKMGTHTGTHMDAPSHIIPDGKNLDDFHLDNFIGRAIVVDIETLESLDDYPEKIDGLIYNSFWYKNFKKAEIYYGTDRPQIPKKIIEFSIKNNLKFFGCDLPSVDQSGSKDKPIHNSLLKKEIIIYESLNNLGRLPKNTPFQFYGVPLPIEGIEGCPVRAFAAL